MVSGFLLFKRLYEIRFQKINFHSFLNLKKRKSHFFFQFLCTSVRLIVNRIDIIEAEFFFNIPTWYKKKSKSRNGAINILMIRFLFKIIGALIIIRALSWLNSFLFFLIRKQMCSGVIFFFNAMVHFCRRAPIG